MLLDVHNQIAGSSRRRAMTVIELVVVLAIVLLLLAVFAPLIRSTGKDRRLREASRAMGGYINGARTLASQRGRPVGIWIERIVSQQQIVHGQYATEVFTAEVPAPYNGITNGATARIELHRIDPTDPTLGSRWEIDFIASWMTGADFRWGNASTDDNGNGVRDDFAERGWQGSDDTPVFDPLMYNPSASTAMVKPGESFRIRFDYRGPLYRGRRLPGLPTDHTYVLDAPYPGSPPPPLFANTASGAPFQLFRHPKRSSAEPLRLPANTAIDLSASGFGASGIELGRGLNDPIVILFNPAGDLDRVYVGAVEVPITDSLYLLIGRPQQVLGFNGLFTSNNVDISNLMDMATLWVSISHRSGQVTTTENASPWSAGADGAWGVAGTDDDGNGSVDDVGERGFAGSDDFLAIFPSRQFARAKIGMGGR